MIRRARLHSARDAKQRKGAAPRALTWPVAVGLGVGMFIVGSGCATRPVRDAATDARSDISSCSARLTFGGQYYDFRAHRCGTPNREDAYLLYTYTVLRQLAAGSDPRILARVELRAPRPPRTVAPQLADLADGRVMSVGLFFAYSSATNDGFRTYRLFNRGLPANQVIGSLTPTDLREQLSTEVRPPDSLSGVVRPVELSTLNVDAYQISGYTVEARASALVQFLEHSFADIDALLPQPGSGFIFPSDIPGFYPPETGL